MLELPRLSEKCLLDFLSKDPYSKLKRVAKYSLSDMLRALNWAAAQEVLDAFYELGLDKTLKRPRSTMEVCFEHYVMDTMFMREILDSLVWLGILDEAAGRYKLRFFRRKMKRPSVVDDFMKTPLRAVFEVIKLMGESIVDVLLKGEKELDWVKDAAIAFEPLEFSPQFVKMRLYSCEMLYGYLKEVLRIENKKEIKLLVTGIASGFGLVNVAQFFSMYRSKIVALEPSEREINLARGLLEEFGLEAYIERYDILKNILKASVVRDVLGEDKGFSASITFERWRFFDKIGRAQILTNLAYSLEVFGSLLDFSVTKEQAVMLNTLLHTIRGWYGYMTIQEKRDFLCTAFQRVKEYKSRLISRADLPLVRGIWL